MKNKLLIAILAITFVFCCAFGFTACNDENDKDNANRGDNQDTEQSGTDGHIAGTVGLEYTLSDDGSYYYLSGLGTCTQTEIVIGNYYNGKPVKQIGKYDLLTESEIYDLVEEVGQEAIKECCIFSGSNVTGVTISEGIETIGAFSFTGYSDITINENVMIEKVKIPDSVKTIGYWAFENCSSLTSITIPDSVTSIGEAVCYNCSGLTSATIGKGVTSISKYAFDNCSSLTSVTISAGVTSIGDSAFEDCEELTSITFKGTKAQWESIEKVKNWNWFTGYYTIHCTDGDIEK